jgi:SAM-dependent methyltransferase
VSSKVVGALRSMIDSADRARAEALHDYENVYLKLRGRLRCLPGEPLAHESRVLDLGCGYRYPNVALFNADGIDVCGADVEPVFFRDGRLATFRTRLRQKGLLRAVLYAGPCYTECQRYFSELARLAQVGLEHRALSLRTYGGRRLPFADGIFSVVCSNAVLEHVEDLPAFVEETARVLRPGGVDHVQLHGFGHGRDVGDRASR